MFSLYWEILGFKRWPKTVKAWSRRIYKEWDSPGKRQSQQPSTDKNGIGVWPNAFVWMQVELRSRSRD